MENAMVHIVEDDLTLRQSLAMLMDSMGIANRTYASGADFLKEYDNSCPNCIVLDLRIPDMSGLEIQETLLKSHCSPPIIFLSGYGDIQTAVKKAKRKK